MRWQRDLELGRIVKYNGQCLVRSSWRFCPHWRAATINGSVYFRCALYDKAKLGYDSLPECNEEHGLTVIPML